MRCAKLINKSQHLGKVIFAQFIHVLNTENSPFYTLLNNDVADAKLIHTHTKQIMIDACFDEIMRIHCSLVIF